MYMPEWLHHKKAKWTQPNIGGHLNFPSSAVLLMRSIPFHGRSLPQFKLLRSLLVVLICRILSYRIQTTGYKCIDWNMEMEEFWISTTSSVMWQMTKTEWVQVQGSASGALWRLGRVWVEGSTFFSVSDSHTLKSIGVTHTGLFVLL